MLTSTQVKELEKVYNRYSCMLEADKGEEKENNARMIAFHRVIEILGYDIELEGETVSYEWASYGVKYNTYRLVRKKDSRSKCLNDIKENIGNVISDLEGKRDHIEYKAWKKGRCMTDKEYKKHDELVNQICSLYDCVEYVENAMDCLEEHTD